MISAQNIYGTYAINRAHMFGVEFFKNREINDLSKRFIFILRAKHRSKNYIFKSY